VVTQAVIYINSHVIYASACMQLALFGMRYIVFSHGQQMPGEQNTMQGMSKNKADGWSLMSTLSLEWYVDHSCPSADL